MVLKIVKKLHNSIVLYIDGYFLKNREMYNRSRLK